jgi:hypothetical protein
MAARTRFGSTVQTGFGSALVSATKRLELQVDDGLEYAALEALARELGKEPFDRVEPGCRGRLADRLAFAASVCRPSISRKSIGPEAGNAQTTWRRPAALVAQRTPPSGRTSATTRFKPQCDPAKAHQDAIPGRCN